MPRLAGASSLQRCSLSLTMKNRTVPSESVTIKIQEDAQVSEVNPVFFDEDQVESGDTPQLGTAWLIGIFLVLIVGGGGLFYAGWYFLVIRPRVKKEQ